MNHRKPTALLIPLNDETLEDTISAARKERAIKAMKKMQGISVSLGNDKMTLKKINTIIRDARKKAKNEHGS